MSNSLSRVLQKPSDAAAVIIINAEEPKARDALQLYKTDELSTVWRFTGGVLVS